MTGPRTPAPAPEGDDYSATVLGSHWISGPPERSDGLAATLRQDGPEAATARLDEPGAEAATARLDGPGAATARFEHPEAVPDRVEGSVLRFGPGEIGRAHV